jgi:hypothetical protein
MSVGVMKDYKLKLRDLHASDTLFESGEPTTKFFFLSCLWILKATTTYITGVTVMCLLERIKWELGEENICLLLIDKARAK